MRQPAASWRARTRRQALIVVATAIVVAAFIGFTSARHGLFDLKVYHGAIRYWVHDGGEIYDFFRPHTRYGFTYPPFAALTMLPMAYLPWPAVMVVSVLAAAVTTAVLVWWLVDPIARREGWTRWFAFAVALCLVAGFEPLRETVNFGQVNTLLMTLVAVDFLWLLPRRSRLAGVGVGLATAIKLTPGIFLLYLVITGRWRAAAVATGTAGAATLFAAAVAPDASREFWTAALWNTDRVGSLGYVSNQSLQGVVARMNPEHPNTLLWLALVAGALAIWAWRARAAVAAGDEVTGFALTAVVGCLVSPVTWVHHLVWLLPALMLLVDNAVAAPPGGRRRSGLLLFAAISYAVLTSRLVWIWYERDTTGVLAFLGSNAYVWVSIALLCGLPVRSAVGRARRPDEIPGEIRGDPVAPASPSTARRNA